MTAVAFVMGSNVMSLQDLTLDTYLLIAMDLYMCSFLMSGGIKHFGRCLLAICVSVNS